MIVRDWFQMLSQEGCAVCHCKSRFVVSKCSEDAPMTLSIAVEVRGTLSHSSCRSEPHR